MKLNNNDPARAIGLMCVANEYLFKNYMIEQGYVFECQKLENIDGKHFDTMSFSKKKYFKKDTQKLYFDLSGFFGKNNCILPNKLNLPETNAPIELAKFLGINDDFIDGCKSNTGVDLCEYSLLFEQYSSEMVAGHVADYGIEDDRTIQVAVVRNYHKDSGIPIVHGYYGMGLMIDHQVQHVIDRHDPRCTETEFSSSYYQPKIGIDCVHHMPLPPFDFANDFLNYTLISHRPNAFEYDAEIRGFISSLQFGYAHTLFDANDVIERLNNMNIQHDTLKTLIDGAMAAS
jgi:hypothetical protein